MNEAAALAGVGQSTLRDWIRAGHLSELWGSRGSRRVRRVNRAELDRHLSAIHAAPIGTERTARAARTADTVAIQPREPGPDLVRSLLDQVHQGQQAIGELRALREELTRTRQELEAARGRIRALEAVPGAALVAAVLGRLTR